MICTYFGVAETQKNAMGIFYLKGSSSQDHNVCIQTQGGTA